MPEVKDFGAAVTQMLKTLGQNDMAASPDNWAAKMDKIKEEASATPFLKEWYGPTIVADILWGVVMGSDDFTPPFPMKEQPSAGGGGAKRRKSRRSKSRRSKSRRGKSRRGKSRRSKSRRGKSRRGKSRRSKSRRSKSRR